MDQLAAGFLLFIDWHALVMLTVGTVIGIIVGAIPGIGPAQLIPLSLPITFSMQPVPALLFLLGEFVGGVYGGSITAILVNTPGTPASVATTFDGYQLACQGKAGKALKLALVSSVVGDVISTTLLLFLAERLAHFSLLIGPAEVVSILVLSLTLVVAVAGPSLTKGFMSAALGGLLAMVGTDSITGTPRLVFGVPELLPGIGLVPLIMGLFAISEILVLAERRLRGEDAKVLDLRAELPENRRLSFGEVWSLRWVMLRSAILGIMVGAIPGLGASVAAMLGYGYARRHSRHPELFGHGSLEGVVGPEAAKNAETSGGLLPFFVLGIPGSALVAMLGGAFLLHGMDPGPLLFQAHGDKMFAIYFGLYGVNVVMLVVGLAGMNLFHYVVRIPRDLLFAIVFILSVVGTYAIDSSMLDIWMVLVFGLVGYFMRKVGIPVAPLLIAFLLVPLLEHNLRQALLISGGSFSVFVESPIAAGFLLLTAAWLAWRGYSSRRSRLGGAH